MNGKSPIPDSRARSSPIPRLVAVGPLCHRCACGRTPGSVVSSLKRETNPLLTSCVSRADNGFIKSKKESIRVLQALTILFATALCAGCSTAAVKSAALGCDWIPAPYSDSPNPQAGLSAALSVEDWGSSEEIKGVRLGVFGSIGGTLTEDDSLWRAGAILNGFLYNVDAYVPGGVGGLLSFGGIAQVFYYTTAKSGPLSISVGPDIVYSFERGPYFDARAALGTAGEPGSIINLSPGGNTLTVLLTFRALWRFDDSPQYNGLGFAVGYGDPDFPSVFYNFPSYIHMPMYGFFEYQNKYFRIIFSNGVGMGTDKVNYQIGLFSNLGFEIFLF